MRDISDERQDRGAVLVRVGVASAVLATGLGYYLLMREFCPLGASFPAVGMCVGAIPEPRAALVGGIPSLAHTVFFAVLLVSIIGDGFKAATVSAWLAVEIGFELLQKGGPLSGAMPESICGPTCQSWIGRGTFDASDLAMCAVGAFAALWLLSVTQRTGVKR